MNFQVPMKAGTLLRIFLTGLLAALPLAATLAVVVWTAQLLLAWIGPDSLLGGLFVALGVGIAGSRAIGYLLGIAIVCAGLFGLGLLVEAGLQRGLARAVNALVRRIPVVGGVYDLAKRVVALFGPDERAGLKSMSAVWCHFGGPGGAAALALLGSPQPVLLGDKPYLAVLIPTSPVPVGGGLLYVPEDWVTPADVGVDAVTSIYVSMGLTSSKYLGPGSRPRAA